MAEGAGATHIECFYRFFFCVCGLCPTQASYGPSPKALLNDDDYDELKSSLTWDGSALVNLSGKEARFLFAVAAARKGAPTMPDAEYAALKQELQAENSWVVSRGMDPLEKLGMQTLLGYIHRSFN